ncbi:uncharacterized protein LOC144946609 [Lampetra fluviatilis]
MSPRGKSHPGTGGVSLSLSVFLSLCLSLSVPLSVCLSRLGERSSGGSAGHGGRHPKAPGSQTAPHSSHPVGRAADDRWNGAGGSRRMKLPSRRGPRGRRDTRLSVPAPANRGGNVSAGRGLALRSVFGWSCYEVRCSDMSDVDGEFADFVASGRSGRRNALVNILGSPAGLSTADLPLKLADLSVTAEGEGATTVSEKPTEQKEAEK